MTEFTFKPFDRMTPEDYAAIGFKSGLEIHQQLLTEKKLFCRCPAGRYSTKYDAEILRHMRPTLSELGEYDGTALMEFKTKKDIIYRINRETVCTYEMDDTPPFLINREALDIAVETGLLFNCNIVDELHIARKQYLDGSIPTGFQRTAIFALDGWIPFRDRKVKIVQMSIEEDSCREVSDQGHTRVYLADRLGMPLIETVTAPELYTPEELAEAARICSNVVRGTNRVRRGIGAAREDVNVSVEGGTRIEIKGVHKISLIPLLAYNEAMRQYNLLRLRDELKKRGITEETFAADSADVTKLVRPFRYQPLRQAIGQGQKVKAVCLRGYNGLLHWQTQTNTYFSKEISDRVRVIACLTSIPNIIHSDSRGETLDSAEWDKVFKNLKASERDTVVLVWGGDTDTKTAVNEIIIRAKEAAVGVPSETRQALRDGTNGFERILPGPDRMYPDTDLPPLKITSEDIEKLREKMPEPYYLRIKRYEKLGAPEDVQLPLSISKYAEVFDMLVNDWNIDPVFASVVLIRYPKRFIKEKVCNPDDMTESIILGVFNAYKIGLISRDGVYSALAGAVRLGKFYPELLPRPCTKDELIEIIKEKSAETENMELRKPSNYERVLLGKVMEEVRGRIPAAIVVNEIEKLTSERTVL